MPGAAGMPGAGGTGAGGAAGSPVLSAADGRKALPAAGVGVGAGVDEAHGEDSVPFVRGDVERGALLSFNVTDRFKNRDERGA